MKKLQIIATALILASYTIQLQTSDYSKNNGSLATIEAQILTKNLEQLKKDEQAITALNKQIAELEAKKHSYQQTIGIIQRNINSIRDNGILDFDDYATIIGTFLQTPDWVQRNHQPMQNNDN